MRRLAIGSLVLAILGCQTAWRAMNQYPPEYLRVLEAARAVLARHYAVGYVDHVRGVVEASSAVNANLSTKFRTKAVARVFKTWDGAYVPQIRVTNELEMSEPSLMGGGQPPFDWRAVGFDHLAETALMAELEAQLAGQTVSVTTRSNHFMFPAPVSNPLRSSGLLRPHIPDPVGGARRPAVATAPAPKAQETAVQAAPEAPKAGRTELFAQHLAMGDLHLERREHEAALLEYQRAALVCPSEPSGHLSLAGAWTALRRYSAGAAALRAAAGAANGARLAPRDLARLRGPEEELRERILLLKGWCRQRPEDLDGRLLLAYHCFLAGRLDEARADLEALLRANPQDPAAQFLARQLEAART